MLRLFGSLLLAVCLTSLTLAESPAAAGKQVEAVLDDPSGDMGYLLYLPSAYEQDPNKLWPLVLFLHGRGESDGPLSLVAKWGPPLMAAKGEDLPFILVSPQCPADGSWSDETRQGQLDRLLNHVVQNLRVESSRIYLTGLSMGGYGSWTLAANHPDRFASVIPVCGGGNPEDASKLKDIPIWVFHGDQDTAVPIAESVEMVEAIKAAGGEKIRFTTLEHVGHNSWSSAYALPELYSWMMEHQSGQASAK